MNGNTRGNTPALTLPTPQGAGATAAIAGASVKRGLRVRIVLKQDQATGRLTEGIVKDILTRSYTHPHGIKVRLTDG